VFGRLGRWDEALELASQALEYATTEFARGLALGRVEIHLARGEVDIAREILTRDADIKSSENNEFAAGYAALEARVLAAEGKTEEALEAARHAVSIADHGPPSFVLFTLLDVAEPAADEETTRALLGLLGSAAQTELTRGVRAQAARLRARLPEYDAEAELETAERIFRELGAQYHLALVLAQRDPDNAEAREIFERLGVVHPTVSDTSISV
jgi:tetratricopeptide (TPR) repeat protein